MAVVELLLPALPEHVRTARLIVTAVARRAGLDLALVDELRLAVGEACSRAVGLHRENDLLDRIGIRVSEDVAGLSVSVTDRGPPAGPRPADLSGSFDTPAADSDADGAYVDPDVALAVLAGLVDEVDVSPGPDGRGTVVTLTWPLARRAPGGVRPTAVARS